MSNDRAIVSKSSTYPLSRLSAGFKPIDHLQTLQDAEKMLGAVAHGKLKIIAEQILYLQEQARKIIIESEVNMELHQASCAFEKRVGHTYHLYRRDSGETYFSMLSIEDWNGNPPHEFLGSYKLEPDMSWVRAEPADNIVDSEA